ncbi:MAG: TIGR01777 family protein [Ignavibacteria bacterium]|nr:MAG: TIGR01777 family protein [Ignavibacteria bacterium]
MAKRIIMTGATGLIGTRVLHALHKRGDNVTILTRNPERAKSTLPEDVAVLGWLTDAADDWQHAVDGADAIIHLAGESIAEERWTEDYKKRIHASRVGTARALIDAIAQAQNKPSTFVSASAVGYYGDSGDTELTEDSPAGSDFLADLCVAWEGEAQLATEHGVRVVTPRLGLVLAHNGGVLEKLKTPFKMFAGGPVGNGEQWFPWIHIDDVVGIILHAMENNQVSGALNAVAPGLVRNREFAFALGEALRRPARFSVPAFVIKLAMGELGETLLGGQRAIPARTIESQYQFRYADIKDALADLIDSTS